MILGIVLIVSIVFAMVAAYFIIDRVPSSKLKRDLKKLETESEIN